MTSRHGEFWHYLAFAAIFAVTLLLCTAMTCVLLYCAVTYVPPRPTSPYVLPMPREVSP